VKANTLQTRQGNEKDKQQDRLRCPFPYEIKDGHLIIEGEDYGEAEKAFANGERLLAFTRVLHEIATA
jgi:hypothetical protein